MTASRYGAVGCSLASMPAILGAPAGGQTRQRCIRVGADARADVRHRRRQPRRRQGGRDPPRRGLRRPRGAARERVRAAVRAAAAVEGLPARRGRREALRPPGGLLRRARDRAAHGHRGGADRSRRGGGLARGRRDAGVRQAAAGHRSRAAAARAARRRARRRVVPALARGLRGDQRAHRRGRHAGDDRRRLDRRRGRRLRPPEGLRGHDPRHGPAAARARPGPRARRDLPRRPQRPRGAASSAA